jgi:hypothetical protein
MKNTLNDMMLLLCYPILLVVFAFTGNPHYLAVYKVLLLFSLISISFLNGAYFYGTSEKNTINRDEFIKAAHESYPFLTKDQWRRKFATVISIGSMAYLMYANLYYLATLNALIFLLSHLLCWQIIKCARNNQHPDIRKVIEKE